MILLAFELESGVQFYRKSNRARLDHKQSTLVLELSPPDRLVLANHVAIERTFNIIVLARFIDCFCLTMWCFTETYKTIDQAPVVQTLHSAIHRINHHPTDKC